MNYNLILKGKTKVLGRQEGILGEPLIVKRKTSPVRYLTFSYRRYLKLDKTIKTGFIKIFHVPMRKSTANTKGRYVADLTTYFVV